MGPDGCYFWLLDTRLVGSTSFVEWPQTRMKLSYPMEITFITL